MYREVYIKNCINYQIIKVSHQVKKVKTQISFETQLKTLTNNEIDLPSIEVSSKIKYLVKSIRKHNYTLFQTFSCSQNEIFHDTKGVLNNHILCIIYV